MKFVTNLRVRGSQTEWLNLTGILEVEDTETFRQDVKKVIDIEQTLERLTGFRFHVQTYEAYTGTPLVAFDDVTGNEINAQNKAVSTNDPDPAASDEN